MNDKEQLIALIEQLPDSVSAETIVAELQFRLTVLRRGADAERGKNIISHEDATQRLSDWLRSPGT